MTTTDTTFPAATGPEEPTPESKGSRRRGSGKVGKAVKPSRTAPPESPRAGAVNLLSTWVLEENRVRTLRLRFLAGAAALVVLLALVWVGLHVKVKAEERSLEEQKTTAAQLRQQIADMAPVRTYGASIRNRDVMLSQAMASEVTFSRALDALEDLLPAGTSIGTFAGTLTPISADGTAAPADGGVSACPGPDPFGVTTVVACVELSGLAPSREAVSQLVLALSTDKQFVEPFISTTTTDDANVVAFSGSVGLDPRMLSGRFTPEDAADAETASAEETS